MNLDLEPLTKKIYYRDLLTVRIRLYTHIDGERQEGLIYYNNLQFK